MSNYAGNIIGGAGTGAAVGAAFGPVGVGVGAVVGGLAGLFTAWADEDDTEEKRKLVEKAAQQYGTSVDNIQRMLVDYYNNNQAIGSKDDVKTYKDLINNYDPNEFVYDYENNKFDDNFDVNNYYAPNRDAIIQKTADTVQATAAGAGIGRGTGAANKIASAIVDKNESMYRDAQNAMNQDRQFAYQLWNTNTQNAQKRLDALSEGYKTRLGLYGDLAKDYQDWNAQKMQQQLDLANSKATNTLNAKLAMASI